MSAKMTPEALLAHLKQNGFWEIMNNAGLEILATRSGWAKSRMKIDAMGKRLGGTISGPSQFVGADTAVYFAVLATLGPEIEAVTSNVSINFLKRPVGEALISEGEILKIGRNQVVGQARVYVEGKEDLVATALVSFSLLRN